MEHALLSFNQGEMNLIQHGISLLEYMLSTVNYGVALAKTH